MQEKQLQNTKREKKRKGQYDFASSIEMQMKERAELARAQKLVDKNYVYSFFPFTGSDFIEQKRMQ